MKFQSWLRRKVQLPDFTNRIFSFTGFISHVGIQFSFGLFDFKSYRHFFGKGRVEIFIRRGGVVFIGD